MFSEVYCYECQKVVGNREDVVKVRVDGRIKFYCKSCWSMLKSRRLHARTPKTRYSETIKTEELRTVVR
ncbi:MAG: hypothetical protein ACKD6N_03550 [Candidatus Bathyarchaeota archaeon]